ncbi:MAG TPA: hypothetical protein G4O08_12770 [Anaerolineae bacterium]|nr:hypothetical protein [Anaerolineae bacterium]
MPLPILRITETLHAFPARAPRSSEPRFRCRATRALTPRSLLGVVLILPA